VCNYVLIATSKFCVLHTLLLMVHYVQLIVYDYRIHIVQSIG